MNMFREYMNGNISKMQVLDFVIDSLKEQGVLSRVDNNTCYYRSPYGTKCAVGMLISEEDYSPSFEQSGASNIFRKLFSTTGLVTQEQEDRLLFLIAIQWAHDNAEAFHNCIRSLESIRKGMTT